MNKLRIYGAEWSSTSTKAMKLVEESGIEYDYADIDGDDENLSEQHRQFLKQENHKTIPQIYEWDEHEYQFKRYIGGYEELLYILMARQYK